MARILLLSLCATLGSLAAAAGEIPPAASWLPDGAVVAVHVEQPVALVEIGAQLKIGEALLASRPDYQKISQMVQLLSAGGAAKADEPHRLTRKLAGDGITWAMYPGDISLLVVDATDAAAMTGLQTLAGGFARFRSNKGAFYEEQPGGALWSIDGKQFFATAGKRLVMSNRLETLKQLWQRGDGGARLASSPLYLEARKTVAGGALVSTFVNTAMLNHYPPFQKSLAGDSWLDFLLTAGLKRSLRQSRWIELGLHGDAHKLVLHAATDGKVDPAIADVFRVPAGPGSGVLPNLSVPHQLAAITLWRDLRKFYAAKDALFPEKTSGGILFENFMEIFFTGRDLADEVFGQVYPEVRLVVAGQQYDTAVGTPLERYPAAALVFHVRNGEEFGAVMEEAWQKAIGISNFTRGQQALPGLILDRGSHGGVPFTFGYYSARTEKDRAHLPARFNVRPALARTGPYLILSSTDALACDLIDAVNREDARLPDTRPPAHTILEISNGAEIAALLEANHNQLVRVSAVASGKKADKAEEEFARNMALLRHLAGVRFSATVTPGGRESDLELRLE